MAYSRKSFCLGPPSSEYQQISFSPTDDASVSSADDDADDDAGSQKNKTSQKRGRLNDKQLNKTIHLHSTFSFINFACFQDPTRFLQVDLTSLVKNGSEKLVKVHGSSYLQPKMMTLESVQVNQKRLKRIVLCSATGGGYTVW
jgi:hypothetical protein